MKRCFALENEAKSDTQVNNVKKLKKAIKMNNLKQSTLTFFLFLALFLSLSSYAVADDVLKLLVWEGYAPPEQVKKFEKYVKEKYNKTVTLDVEYISNPNDFFKALRLKKADIITPTHNLIKDKRFNFIDKELILPLDLKNIPNYSNIIPALQKADYISKDGKPYGVPFAHGPYGLAYNTKHIKSPPDSWNIFWDPMFAKKYTISSDYYEVNIYVTALSLGYKVEQIGDYTSLNNPEFKARLKSLRMNAKNLWKGVDGADDLQGLSLAMVWGMSFPELKKRGEIWKMAYPKEGTMGWVDNYVIGYSLKDKPFLKKIAEEWLNFVIGPDFQVEAMVRGINSSPVNLTARDLMTAEEIELFHMDQPNFFQKNRILWPTIKKQRNRHGMKILWDDAAK